MSLPRQIINKISMLAEPYALFPSEMEVDISQRFLDALDNILVVFKRYPTRFNAYFFPKWNKAVVQFNLDFELTIDQLKQNRNLKALQNLYVVVKNAPKDLYCFEFWQLKNLIEFLTIRKKQTEMTKVMQSEMQQRLEQEFKQNKIEMSYLQLMTKEQDLQKELDEAEDRLSQLNGKLNMTIEEYVDDVNSEPDYDAWDSYSQPKLILHMGESRHWTEEDLYYEDISENEEALIQYNVFRENARNAIPSVTDEIENLKRLLIQTQARREKADYDLPERSVLISRELITNRLYEKDDVWRKLQVFFDTEKAEDDFVMSVCNKLDRQFKLASIKKLPSTVEPSAPSFYPTIEGELEDEFEPGSTSVKETTISVKGFADLETEIKMQISRYRKNAQSCFGIRNNSKADRIEQALTRVKQNGKMYNSLNELLDAKFHGQESLSNAISYHRIGFFGRTRAQKSVETKVAEYNNNEHLTC